VKFRIIIDRERCKGCVMCVSVCPKSVLIMTKKLNSKGNHYPETPRIRDCVGCQQCALICPDAAIEIEQEDA
jgi:2-oxoglutarate ferredoxin oxidoreductase subunit delta